MSRQNILKTLIVGTERSPLAENDLALFGLSPSADPAKTALEALAAANLASKAGFQLAVADDSSSGELAEIDGRAICSNEAIEDLKLILSGRYADALPEFLNLLTQNNLRLPPELLPELLDKAERDFTMTEKIRPAFGARGEWLARQNPRWQSLLAEKKPKIASPPRKKGKQTSNSPLLEFETFTETWTKVFLENLLEQYRQSVYDEGEIPGWHFILALQTAAYHCQPDEAANSAFVRDYLQNPPKPRPREFEHFLAIIRFRQKMRQHLHAIKN